jgi:hypothetical protein
MDQRLGLTAAAPVATASGPTSFRLLLAALAYTLMISQPSPAARGLRHRRPAPGRTVEKHPVPGGATVASADVSRSAWQRPAPWFRP